MAEPIFDFERSSEDNTSVMTDVDADEIMEVMGEDDSIESFDLLDSKETGQDCDWLNCYTKSGVLTVIFASINKFYLFISDNEDLKFWEGIKFHDEEDVRKISELFISKVIEKIGIPFEFEDEDDIEVDAAANSDDYEVGDLQTMSKRLKKTFKAVDEAIQEMCATRAEWLKDTTGVLV